MGAVNRVNVSDAELEVLKVLGLRGPATVRDVAQHLKRRHKPWVYTTILTLLSRLRDKGSVQYRAMQITLVEFHRPHGLCVATHPHYHGRAGRSEVHSPIQ